MGQTPRYSVRNSQVRSRPLDIVVILSETRNGSLLLNAVKKPTYKLIVFFVEPHMGPQSNPCL